MFGTSGIRGTVGTDVTASLALSVGRAVASEGYDRVVVGRDPRDSGQVLVDAVAAGLRECGADVIEVGVEATPTIARAVGTYDADAGVAVTASHNPPTDNGLKLWTPSGQAFGTDQREAIERRLADESADLRPWDELGTRRKRVDAAEHHAAAIAETVSIDDPPRVVVDIGNGAGGLTASLLAEAGCHVETLNGQPDGAFPGRPSEPNRETLSTLMALLESTDATVGIAHDGDADRMVAVDDTGSFVPKDVLLALFAREAASEGDRIAAPVDTSLAVDDAVAEVGASVTRTRVGDVYVAERATEPDVVFGGEPSGAWIWPEETLCPDAPLAACKLVELVADRGPLSALVDTVETYPIDRTSIEVQDKPGVMERVEDRVRSEYAEIETIDGVRVDSGDGWFLIRASGTESVVRVTAEAREHGRMESLFAEAIEIVESAARSTDADT